MKELNSKDIDSIVKAGKNVLIENGKVYEVKKRTSRIKEFFAKRQKREEKMQDGFRGLTKDCKAEELLTEYLKEPNSEAENKELSKILIAKPQSFFMELLNFNEYIGIDILSDGLSPHTVCEIYKKWLIESHQVVDVVHIDRIIDKRLSQSQAALHIITRAFLKAEEIRAEYWTETADKLPTETNYYECTIHDEINDENFVRTLKFTKNTGTFWYHDGEKADVIAWRVAKPYVKK